MARQTHRAHKPRVEASDPLPRPLEDELRRLIVKYAGYPAIVADLVAALGGLTKRRTA